MLRIHQYEKAYGSEPVLLIPDLFLPNGIYHIAGVNGAGKTTLLKSIAGLIPFKGDIKAAGISIRKSRMQYRKAIGHAEAEPQYPGFLTGSDLIHFYVQTKGGSKENAMGLAINLGVDQYMHQRVDTYSSGMIKKLSLVLAFTGYPKLILLDEPLITLDSAAVQTIVQLIAAFHEKGVGFLISSRQQFDLPLPYSTLWVKHKTLQ